MQRTYHFELDARTNLPVELTQRLATESQHRHCADGSWILQRGDVGDGFWLILKGQVIAGRYGDEGNFLVYAVLGAGDLFGELAFFTDAPRQIDAIADGPAELAWIDGARVKGLLRDEPEFAYVLLRSLANQLRASLNRIEEAATLSISARCARMLADLAERGGARVELTQQGLADLLGTSRVSVGKALSEFAAEGQIERGYGWIAVTNPKQLRDQHGGNLVT
jgi:CRP/FNR family transcriptional regulator, cyclic AMP receptor protein